MKAWRIAKSEYAGSVEEMLDGEGAARYGGRWNPKGMRAVYCSENSSLAALEVLAGLVRASAFPSYRVLDLDIPDSVIAAPGDPGDDSQLAGAELLQEHVAIMVRSVVNPLERNIVINPLHSAFGRIAAGRLRPFPFDQRLRGQVG